MFSGYLKIAIRNFRRHPGYTIVTLAGLIAGASCCLIIALWVKDEASYDRFHPEVDRLYRVIAERGAGDDTHISATTSYPVIPTLKADFPEIKTATRARRTFRPIVSTGDKQFREERFYAVDSTFFEVFPYHLLDGDPESALAVPGGVVLTRATARRYFGSADPMGKYLRYQTGTQPIELTVTGIVEDPPDNTHLPFDFLGNIETIGGPFGRWQVFVQNYSYVRLADFADPAALEGKFDAFVDRHIRSEMGSGEVFRLYLQPVTDIHLTSRYQAEAEPNGSITYVYLFSAIAVFVLIIACVNFINMMTARSARRAREVGLRKSVGASRRQLVSQFLAESVLLSFTAVLASALLAELLMPFFNTLTGKELSLTAFGAGQLVAGLTVLSLTVGFCAGIYPAFFLASFRPADTLKGGRTGSGGALTRHSLVVFQFTASIALIACTLIVYQQMQFIQTKDLGFEKEQVVAIPIDRPTGIHSESVKRSLEQHSSIIGASASMLVPSTDVWTYNVRRAQSQDLIDTGFYKVDHDFADTYGLRFAAGRNFRPGLASDSSDAFLVNEELARRLGFASAQDALDEPLIFGDGSRSGRIVGVIEDFHVRSLHEHIQPIVFILDPEYYYLSARVAPSSIGPALTNIERVLAAQAPHLPFDYFFVDEQFNALHRSDRNVGEIFALFALLAVLIAALGLFGLAAHTAEQRRKEIGIRKTLGATVPRIVALLSTDFLKLVGIAAVIGSLIAYVAMETWLDGFAYRVDVGMWVFAAVGVAAGAAACLSVGYQSIAAALEDPVKCLRYE